MDEQLRCLDGLTQADPVRAEKASPAELKAAARERIRRRCPALKGPQLFVSEPLRDLMSWTFPGRTGPKDP